MKIPFIITPETKFRIIFPVKRDGTGEPIRSTLVTTAKHIEQGLGFNSLFDDVVRFAYETLKSEQISGTVRRFCGVTVQIDIVDDHTVLTNH